jgi:transposase
MWLYARRPTDTEQPQLEQLARSGDTITYRHARIVLLSLAGQKVPAIQAALGLSDRTVRDTLRRFNARGPQALVRRKAPGAARRLDAAARTRLVELLHRPPTDFGIESRLWTAPDLARVAVEQGLVEAVSPDTIREEIRRAGKSWKRAKRWTTSPDPDYQRKKGNWSG